MLPAACLVISFFPSTAPYLLLWQLNATRGANEIPSHIEIQITHQLDEQANVEYIGTAISKCDRLGNGSTRGGLVRCIGDKLSSVGQANRTEQNRSKEEEVTKKMFNLLKDHRVSSDVNDDKNAPLDYLGGRFLFFFLFRGGDENHSLSIPFRQQFLNNKNYETNPIQVFFNSILHCCCLRTCKIISLFNELTCHTHRMHFIMAVQFIIEDHCRWSHFPCPRLIYPHFR